MVQIFPKKYFKTIADKRETSNTHKRVQKRHSFFLVEAIVATLLFSALFFGVGLLYKNTLSTFEVRKREVEAQRMLHLAQSSLIEKLFSREINEETIINNKSVVLIPEGRDLEKWGARCSFALEKRDPQNPPKALLFRAQIFLAYGGDETAPFLEKAQGKFFDFCIGEGK
jgi:hypothetical protein